MIADLVKKADADKDAAAGIFLQWFVTEQVEEEKQTDEVVQMLKMVGDSAQILMLDAQLGKRE